MRYDEFLGRKCTNNFQRPYVLFCIYNWFTKIQPILKIVSAKSVTYVINKSLNDNCPEIIPGLTSTYDFFKAFPREFPVCF
jgi:hypothetical protein